MTAPRTPDVTPPASVESPEVAVSLPSTAAFGQPLVATFESGSCGHIATRCECDYAAGYHYPKGP